MFDLEEKVNSERFSSDRVLRMDGKGWCEHCLHRSLPKGGSVSWVLSVQQSNSHINILRSAFV